MTDINKPKHNPDCFSDGLGFFLSFIHQYLTNQTQFQAISAISMVVFVVAIDFICDLTLIMQTNVTATVQW
ncbi:hypothetical protein BCT35_17785 [Vibrio lentus]|nr:hypothetical protein BCU45_15925 [Vibrio lentus]PMJ57386.1 hypothetical protein BCU20_14495 [Vibrio lentus]PML43734.1 hypothetical protein BCT75_07720 [Vibrio lentus]PMN04536.1 hypothetical protein BCT42_12980 [Vibrio lentus]PMN30730.1 hypothetical protein BCT35_17785 [Vibrio lentus]